MMRAMRLVSRMDRFEELLTRKHDGVLTKTKDHDEHRATERAADAAPVLEEVPHL